MLLALFLGTASFIASEERADSSGTAFQLTVGDHRIRRTLLPQEHDEDSNKKTAEDCPGRPATRYKEPDRGTATEDHHANPPDLHLS